MYEIKFTDVFNKPSNEIFYYINDIINKLEEEITLKVDKTIEVSKYVSKESFNKEAKNAIRNKF